MDVHQQADGHPGREHRGSAVRHERQRHAGHRHDARGSSRCSRTPGTRASRRGRSPPGGRTGPRRAARSGCRARERPRAAARCAPAPTIPSSSPATEYTKSVCCFGHELALGLGAVEQALAEEPARARSRCAPARCCSRRRRVGARVEERARTGRLVRVDHAGLHRHDRAEERAADDAHQPPGRRARHREDRRARCSAMTSDGAEVGLQHDQRDRHGGDRERLHDVDAARLVLARRASPPGSSTARGRSRSWRTPTAGWRSRPAG